MKPPSVRLLWVVLGGVAVAGCASVERSSAVSIAPVYAEPSPPPGLTTGAAPQEETPTRDDAVVEPTWAGIYARYLGPNTEGGCARSHACHAEAMANAAAAYDWLSERGYIAGTQSPLVSTRNSCLRWFGGNMPPRGQPNVSAAREFAAWVAAGAKND